MNEDGILANIPNSYTIPEMTPDRIREILQQLVDMRSIPVDPEVEVLNPRRVGFEYTNQMEYLGWASYRTYPPLTPRETTPVDPNKCSCDNGVIKGKYEDEECERCGGTGRL